MVGSLGIENPEMRRDTDVGPDPAGPLAAAQEDPQSSVIDQQELPPQGRAGTAAIVIAVVALLIAAALFIGLRYSRPGGGMLLIPGGPAQNQQ